MSGKLTAIVTGASGGIGGGLVEGFLEEGYNVVATSRNANQRLTAARGLVILEGDICKQQTAIDAVETAINNFGTVDVLVNNAGIFLNKPFTDFTVEDFDALVSTNLLGFLHMTQRTVKEMLKQKSGCVVSITAALADRPIAGTNGSVSMITKGGLNSAIENLAVEYAQDGIRFNGVAPGVVSTPMHPDDPRIYIASDHEKGDGEGYRRSRSLPGTSRSCERRNPPRRWCCTGASVVSKQRTQTRVWYR
jgi:NAD(P)-dependent dehydrogenase (short-subunit alcohol dehydrogenase family)